MRRTTTTMTLAMVTALAAIGFSLADGHGEQGPCADQLEKLTPYWEEMGFGQHGDITGFMRLSHDARYLVFGSFGNYFVPGVPGTSEGGTRQIYLLDRDTGAFEVITVAHESAEGDFGNGQSGWLLDMSPNGRYVAYTSVATNLVEPNELINGEYTHVYVRDLHDGVTLLASVSSEGEAANEMSGTGSIGVSNNGRVAFTSRATNLVEGHGGHIWQAYVHDLDTGETQIVSVDQKGQAGQSASSYAAISADGTLVTFNSPSALDPSLPWNFHNLWGHDLNTGVTEAISVDDNGDDRFGVGSVSRVSADGRHVVFMFDSSEPLDPEMPQFTSLYVRDRVEGTTRGVATDIDGNPMEISEFDIAISADGRFVSWDNWSQVTEGETHDQRQVYRADMLTGEIIRASIDVHCEAIQEESDALFPAMSGDGSTVIFTTVWDVMQNDDGGKFPHDWAHHVYAWIDPDFKQPSVPGDLNGDGVVDVSDLLILLAAWGPCPRTISCPADLNGDGTVDVSDLLALLANWG